MSVTTINSGSELIPNHIYLGTGINDYSDLTELAHDAVVLVSAAYILGRLGFKEIGRELLITGNKLMSTLITYLNTGKYYEGLADKLYTSLSPNWPEVVSDHELIRILNRAINLRFNTVNSYVKDYRELEALKAEVLSILRKLGVKEDVIQLALNSDNDSLIQLIATLTATLLSRVEVMLR